MHSVQGFIISRQWQETRSGTLLRYWLHTQSGPLLIELPGQESIFFVEQKDIERAKQLIGKDLLRATPLALSSFNHEAVYGFYFSHQSKLNQAARKLKQHNIEPFEYDVRTVDRYLMERFINASIKIVTPELSQKNKLSYTDNAKLMPSNFYPDFSVISFDIETSYNSNQLFSIALYSNQVNAVLMVSDTAVENVHTYPNERSLIKAFFSWIEHYDPDILIGWNCINFDLRFLEKCCERLNLRFELGRDREIVEWRTHPENDNHHFVTVPGRAVIDGIDMLKMATYHFESFALESVARELLGKGKLIHDPDDRGEEITRLFEEDKPALARYNLEDCALVWEIFETNDLINFSIERANMTGIPIDKIGGSVAAFENQYLPRLHRQGYVAPNIPENPIGVGSPGGYVMSSQPGFYEHVLVLDFKSLYPSIIRSFHIEPYALTEGDRLIPDRDDPDYDIEKFSKGFNRAFFKKEQSILPGLIEQLWSSRDEAKKADNQALSQAIKIIMNSFYGVMGTPGCRFFDRRLPSSVTLRGHEIMNKTRELIEARGYQVIYGDTDSIFVWLNQDLSSDQADDIGKDLSSYITQWWRDHLQSNFKLTSALELEYENHYSRFLMPTIRGSNEGTKKRYAGLVCSQGFSFDNPDPSQYELVFKGLETVRTDWTPIARTFQKKLYERIFLGQPYKDYVLNTVEEIRSGHHDSQLVYRKRLRRKLSDYQRNIPPHVQAAKKADDWLVQQGKKARYQYGGWIEYVYTVNGPEPREYNPSRLDYDLYLERQIAPIVDGIVSFLGHSYEELTSQQINLL